MSNEIQRLKNLANSGIGESDADLLRSIANRLESDAKRDAQYDALQEIGKSAYASIAEMVAALECDYDRLEELKEERTTLIDADKEARAELLAFGYVGDADEETQTQHAKISTAAREAKTALASWTEENSEELAELESAAGECESRDDAEQRIQEDALSVEVRSGWHEPGGDSTPEEFTILLSTGGPATRIIGEFDKHGEPTRARLQAQDWGTPWTDVHFQDGMDETLLTYCRCFYFGEG